MFHKSLGVRSINCTLSFPTNRNRNVLPNLNARGQAFPVTCGVLSGSSCLIMLVSHKKTNVS